MKQRLQRFLLIVLPPAISALLQSVIQAPVNWSLLAWVAWVPFAWMCSPAVRGRSVFLAAYLVAIAYWLVNLYWLAWITVAGWITMGFYIGLLWPLLALALRWCRGKGVPLFVALPVLLVGIERLQGFPLGGFYWRLLGHSQYTNLAVIQIADVLGVAGVTFAVAMVNGFFADVLIWLAHRKRPTESTGTTPFIGQILRYAQDDNAWTARRVAVGGVLTLAAIWATVLYGQWRLRQTPSFMTAGPKVAALQSNIPQSVKGSGEASQSIFDDLMASNRAAEAAGAELVVWPETMVQAIIEPNLWPYLSPPPDEDRAFHQALIDAAKGHAYILVGAHGAEVLRDVHDEVYLGEYNSAYLYRPDGTLAPGRYDKIHLVLFGEYIPFRRSWNWLYQQLKHFAPPEYGGDYSLEHGSHYTIFEMDPNEVSSGGSQLQTSNSKLQTPYHFAVIICYEDAIPYVARNFALDENGHKRIDWLVNISNDGWFVNNSDGWFASLLPSGPSTELAQHAAICTFRAVENRLAVVRSVNTGISCLIDSVGRIHDGYLASSEGFPSMAMERTGMAGWFLDQMPIDSRVTFYSRHGQWLDTSCAAVLVAVLVAPVALRLARRVRGRAKPKKSR